MCTQYTRRNCNQCIIAARPVSPGTRAKRDPAGNHAPSTAADVHCVTASSSRPRRAVSHSRRVPRSQLAKRGGSSTHPSPGNRPLGAGFPLMKGIERKWQPGNSRRTRPFAWMNNSKTGLENNSLKLGSVFPISFALHCSLLPLSFERIQI